MASPGATSVTPILFAAAISARASSSLQMRPERAAPPRARQIGQPLQRRARVTEMIEERIKGSRADVVAADQPQPVDPVGLGEVGCELCPVMHAVAALPNLRL